jgi:hypothetical protein
MGDPEMTRPICDDGGVMACADNGYDTAELGDIVKDAKKAVSR